MAHITRDLLNCLNVLDRIGIAHRNIKPANLLMCHDENNNGSKIKLADYGMASFVGVDNLVRRRNDNNGDGTAGDDDSNDGDGATDNDINDDSESKTGDDDGNDGDSATGDDKDDGGDGVTGDDVDDDDDSATVDNIDDDANANDGGNSATVQDRGPGCLRSSSSRKGDGQLSLPSHDTGRQLPRCSAQRHHWKKCVSAGGKNI